MPAASPLADHLSPDQLRSRYLSAPTRIEGIRWHALVLRSQGHSHAQIANITQRGTRWVSPTIRRYNEGGPDAVADQREHNGKAPFLSDAQQDELRALLQQPHPDGGLWTSAKVLAWIEEQLGGEYTLTMAYDDMHRLAFSQQVPRPQHQRADQTAQDAVKKGGLPEP